MDIIENLGQFSLTRQEAALYLVLAAEGELSGYEAARQAGISRSNAYAALAALAEKGAVYRLDGATPRYQAVPVADFCAHKLRFLQDCALQLEENIPQRREAVEGYLTIQGRQNIVDRMRSMISGARERIYLDLPPTILSLARAELEAALKHAIKLVVICSQDPGLPGATIHLYPQPEQQVRLIVDSNEVLTGELGADQTATCLYSKRKQLVDLFKDALRNEIKLIELGQRGCE